MVRFLLAVAGTCLLASSFVPSYACAGELCSAVSVITRHARLAIEYEGSCLVPLIWVVGTLLLFVPPATGVLLMATAVCRVSRRVARGVAVWSGCCAGVWGLLVLSAREAWSPVLMALCITSALRALVPALRREPTAVALEIESLSCVESSAFATAAILSVVMTLAAATREFSAGQALGALGCLVAIGVARMERRRILGIEALPGAQRTMGPCSGG